MHELAYSVWDNDRCFNIYTIISIINSYLYVQFTLLFYPEKATKSLRNSKARNNLFVLNLTILASQY